MNSAATDAEEAAELRFGCAPPLPPPLHPHSAAAEEGGGDAYVLRVHPSVCVRVSLWISAMLPR